MTKVLNECYKWAALLTLLLEEPLIHFQNHYQGSVFKSNEGLGMLYGVLRPCQFGMLEMV